MIYRKLCVSIRAPPATRIGYQSNFSRQNLCRIFGKGIFVCLFNRTATMDDIYRHFDSKTGAKAVNKTNVSPSVHIDSGRRQDKISEEYEEGDVTGFAVQNPISTPVRIYIYTLFRQ